MSKQQERVDRKIRELKKALSDLAPRHVNNPVHAHLYTGLLVTLEDVVKQTTSGLTYEEVAALKDERKILAIKLVRERTNMSLADAKRHVENAQRELGL